MADKYTMNKEWAKHFSIVKKIMGGRRGMVIVKQMDQRRKTGNT